VEADRFLHHMVRMLVGTMVEIGLGRRQLGELAELLSREDNRDTGPPAPPQGLYFIAASYPPELFLPASEAHAAAYLG
jgi:tRNA pseudouridine38-40 synthase